MAAKYNRGYIGQKSIVSDSYAEGMNTLREHAMSVKEGNWPKIPVLVSAVSSTGGYSFSEGDAITINVTTSDVLSGTTIYWHIVGTGSAPVTSADFLGGTVSGSTTVTGNQASFTLPTANPVDTEGDEYFYVGINFSNPSPWVSTIQTPTFTLSDATGPTLSVEFVAGSYSWVDGTTLSRVNSTTRDDGYFGPWSIGFDFPYGGTNYNNNVYNATNGFITFGSANQQITNAYTQNSNSSCMYGYPRDMYQGYSTNWGIHGSGNGNGHGVFTKAAYTPVGASATYCKAWIISLGQTTYTSSYRGQNFSQTYILVSDGVSPMNLGKTWIEFINYGVGNAGNYFPQTGIRVGGTNVGGGNMSSIAGTSIVYEGDNNGQNFTYKGQGKLRVIGTSNWVFGTPGST